MRDEPLALRHQPPGRDGAGRHAALDGLDQRGVLAARSGARTRSSRRPRRRTRRRRRSSPCSRRVRPGPSGPRRRARRSAGPGLTLSVTFGQSQWNCARRISPGRPGRAARRTGPRTSGASEQVASGAHVDRPRQARVGDRAVVALEVVLDATFQLAAASRGRGAGSASRSSVDAAAREHVGQRAERVRERRRVRVGVHEERTGPTSRPRRGAGRARRGRDRARVAARDLAQRAVEVVGPRVVRALQRRAGAGAREHRVAAVAAHVDQRAQLAVAAADDRERDRAGVGAQVAARRGDLLGPPGVLPAAPEDPLAARARAAPGRRTSGRAGYGRRPGRRRRRRARRRTARTLPPASAARPSRGADREPPRGPAGLADLGDER